MDHTWLMAILVKRSTTIPVTDRIAVEECIADVLYCNRLVGQGRLHYRNALENAWFALREAVDNALYW